MPKNRIVWLILEIAFYLLVVFLVLDFINSIIERSKENSTSKINQITLITEVEKRIKQSENKHTIEPLRERRQLWNEQQQQEWKEQQQQWRDHQREQQQESRDIRRQQQERIHRQNDLRRQQQERIRQRQELI